MGARRLAWAFGLLVGLACGPKPVRTPDHGPAPDAATALRMLRNAGRGRHNMRTLGQLTYFGKDGRIRLKTLMVVERPSSFRFETISPFEQPIDVMASNGSELWLLTNGRLMKGIATPENISRLLPLPLRSEELVDTLLGGVPTSDRFVAESIRTDEEGQWLMTLRSDQHEVAHLVVDPERLVVVEARLEEAGGAEPVVASFREFEPVSGAGGQVPRELQVVIPGRGLDVRLKLREVEINARLDPGLFVIQPPPGIEAEPMTLPVP